MDYQDLNLRTTTEEPTDPAPPPAPPPRSALGPQIVAGLLVLAVIVAGYVGLRSRRATPPANEPVATPVTAPAAPTSLGTEAEAVIIPPLDDSDDAVRELVKTLSSNPSVAAWLATKDLIRNFTLVITNIANGEPASKPVPVLKPRGLFQIEERDEELFIDPRSYARYLPLSTAVSSIDPAGAARLYTTLKPRIEDAYRELGYPDTPFDQTLERAIVLLLRTPIPAGRVKIEPSGGTSYRFADPTLEKLTPSQKLLLRMGSDNQRAVQSSLRAIALALGITEEKLR